MLGRESEKPDGINCLWTTDISRQIASSVPLSFELSSATDIPPVMRIAGSVTWQRETIVLH